MSFQLSLAIPVSESGWRNPEQFGSLADSQEVTEVWVLIVQGCNTLPKLATRIRARVSSGEASSLKARQRATRAPDRRERESLHEKAQKFGGVRLPSRSFGRVSIIQCQH